MMAKLGFLATCQLMLVWMLAHVAFMEDEMMILYA